MDPIQTTLSPLVLGSILLSTVLLVTHVIFDYRKATVERWYRKKMQGRKRHSFTVVVDLAKRADTIVPLFDHLAIQSWPKLEVIILVRHTAGARAVKQLREYRRIYPFKLRIVMHKKGLTIPNVISRYSTSDLIVQLNAHDRIGQDFFAIASTYFRDNSLGLLVARRHILLGSTLSSALQASISVWSDAVHPIKLRNNGILTGGVYRRRTFLSSGQVLHARYATNLHFTQASEGWRTIYRRTRSIELNSLIGRWCAGYAVLGAVLCVLALFMDLSEIRFIAVMLGIGYGLVFMAQLKGLKAYSIVDRTLLILFSPFSLICIAILVGIVHLSNLGRLARKLGVIRIARQARVH